MWKMKRTAKKKKHNKCFIYIHIYLNRNSANTSSSRVMGTFLELVEVFVYNGCFSNKMRWVFLFNVLCNSHLFFICFSQQIPCLLTVWVGNLMPHTIRKVGCLKFLFSLVVCFVLFCFVSAHSSGYRDVPKNCFVPTIDITTARTPTNASREKQTLSSW